jgi:hypothetical protein
MIRRVPTWFWEQVVLVALLAPSLALAVQADPSARGVARAVVGGLGAVAAQKARSGASRRGEQDALRGVTASALRCDRAISRWASIAQALAVASLFLGAPAGRWGYLAAVLPAVYVYAYGALWRPWYRRLRPARPE